MRTIEGIDIIIIKMYFSVVPYILCVLEIAIGIVVR